MLQHLEEHGHAAVRGLLRTGDIASCLQALPAIPKAGLRNAVRTPALRDLASSSAVVSLAKQVAGPSPRLVRAILFDKSPEANWSVPWHQDVTIAVRERIDTPGFGPWSVKDELPHVTPPPEILAAISTIRIHLDDCPETNGPLQVIPQSHNDGLLTPAQIDQWKSKGPIVTLEAQAGDAILFKPLALHASAKSIEPKHRRVLHLEYACTDLPNGLAWPNWSALP
jgi:ectoine hydroxylase-related dioxygenase (phytanoyl-CoA dioxygenase family)